MHTTCGACRTFRLDPDSKLSQHGYGNCAQLPVWHYMSRLAACHFNPSRFTEFA